LSLANPEIGTEFDYLFIWLCYRFSSFACYYGESSPSLPLPSSLFPFPFPFSFSRHPLFSQSRLHDRGKADNQITDYYLVRNRKLHVPMLYQNEGIYRYKGGVNWRAVVALFIVIPINLPGLINAIDKTVQTGNHKFFCTSPSSIVHLVTQANI
jgi:hypothetical protein